MKRALLLLPLALLLAVDRTLGVDLCALLGICNNNNNGRQFPNQHQHHGTPEWVDFGGSGKLYYFGFDAGPMDWWEADRYCERKGGYLAEPQSHSEHNFLSSQARKYGANNWWLGLRLTEDCRCEPRRGGGGRAYDATINAADLRNRHNDYAHTSCRPGFQKRCGGGGGAWRWVSDGRPARYSAWNRATGEPHGPPEYCATMWTKAGYNWGDWRCSLRTDSGHPFRPVCEKSSFGDYNDHDYPDHNDYDYHDDFTNGGGGGFHGDICADYDMIYRGGQVVKNHNNVPNADVCRARCIQYGRGCVAWSWQGRDSRRQRCNLFGSHDYRASYSRGAVSGTLRGRCDSLALSQLSRCFCEDPQVLGSGDYDYGDFDFVSDGLLRTHLGGNNPAGGLCRRGQVLRCMAPPRGGGGGVTVVTRGGGGVGGVGGGGGGGGGALRSGGNRNRGNTDSSAVNFG